MFKYEKYFKDQHPSVPEDPHNVRNSHIKQFIANQYLNKSTNNSNKKPSRTNIERFEDEDSVELGTGRDRNDHSFTADETAEIGGINNPSRTRMSNHYPS